MLALIRVPSSLDRLCSKVPALSLHSQAQAQAQALLSNLQLRPTPPTNLLFKKLSEAEWKAKKEKGLCFRCDEKYSIGHKCINKELQVMLIYDAEQQEEWGTKDSVEEITKVEKAMIGEVVVSMNSIVGLKPPQTMKLKGEI